MSKYLARKTDGAIFKQNKDGTYSMVNTEMHNPYKYKKEGLSDEYFEEITKLDFPRMRDKRNEFYAYESWRTRSDGHGGNKGGTIEDFRELDNYEKMKVDTDEALGELI